MKNIANHTHIFREVRYLCKLSVLAISLTSCFTQESTPSSSGGSAISDDTPVKWNSSSLSGGMNVKVAQEILDDFVGADDDSNGLNPVEQMFDQWNDATSAQNFFDIPAAATSNLNYSDLTDYRDSEMGIYKSHSWFSNVQSSVLAVTQYYGYRKNTGTSSEYIEMSHADIIMNYKDYNFNTTASSTVAYDFHSVVLHELGHFLGLGHTSSYSVNSVMLPSLSISSSKREVSAYDKASIVELYGGSSALIAQNSALSVSRSAASVATTKVLPESARQISDDGEIHGLIELRADGKCTHFINGKAIDQHQVALHKRLK